MKVENKEEDGHKGEGATAPASRGNMGHGNPDDNDAENKEKDPAYVEDGLLISKNNKEVAPGKV